MRVYCSFDVLEYVKEVYHYFINFDIKSRLILYAVYPTDSKDVNTCYINFLLISDEFLIKP